MNKQHISINFNKLKIILTLKYLLRKIVYELNITLGAVNLTTWKLDIYSKASRRSFKWIESLLVLYNYC